MEKEKIDNEEEVTLLKGEKRTLQHRLD